MKLVRILLSVVVAGTAFLIFAPKVANAVTVDSFAQGLVRWDGYSLFAIGNGARNGHNTFTGYSNIYQYSSWAAFNIPVGSYSAATLDISPSSASGLSGPLFIGLFPVSVPFTILQPDNAELPFPPYFFHADYGVIPMFNTPMSLGPLGGNAVADINAAAGAIFIIGFDDLSSPALRGGIYTSGLQTDSPVLELTATPLPAALPLFATGLGALSLLGWRRKRKAAAIAAA